MNIIIPMCGLSSRFTKAGYTLPKYMLYANGKSLFRLAVESFKHYFNEKFVFVCRDVYDTPRFIKEECKLIGITNYNVVIAGETSGQAETVKISIEESHISGDILIFNIDTFRPEFKMPEFNCDGFLECFEGSGSNWSYAKTNEYGKVIETAEKREISNYCSDGIYYFKNASDFLDAYNNYNDSTQKERYVAPLYNYLVKNRNIRVKLIDRCEVIFCGTPDEYTSYLEQTKQL